MSLIKKFFLRIILFMIFIIALFELKTYATSDFSYKLNASGDAIITAYNGSESDLTIPSTIDGYNVMGIDEHCFHENHNKTNGNILKNVVISEGIVDIGGWAFCDCENLESVKLPESLTSLGWQVFTGCKKLTTINIPHKLTILNDGFVEDTAIEEIIVPENIQKFVGDEFRSCDNLKKVFIYNDNINYYNNDYDTNVFEYCNSVVLYANEGSTTQAYAQQHGLTFKLLSEYDDEIDDTDVPVTSLSLSKTSLSLNIGDVETLTATVSPDNATDKSIVWSSSDTSVATVENGEITAVSVGTATITAKSSDGSVTVSCNVTVSEESSDSKSDSSNPNSVNNSAVPKNNTTNSAFSNYTGTITRLPNAGISSILLIILLVLLILAPIIYKYYHDLRKID